ncbi:MAG: type 4a pilus biogenesis protein PilO [Candidatus Thiodiazotropha sp. (ex Lucinoma borealis)]|nr:type 4a pilus biogenesis protein PilO [Candidatus Thiodiazotropha sp. (ex Lucinoma borealis)]MCU7866773.1 type 4a pilus biogenesis protein PilO [Candidatus Thiodiazotropha sp. (ex Lucinoma borealis)]
MKQFKPPVRVIFALRNGYLQLGILVLFIGLFFLLWSYFGYFRVWQNRHENQMSEYKHLQYSITNLKNDFQQYEQYKEILTTLESLEKRLSSRSSQVEMVGHLNDLARSSGVRVKASTFKHGKPDNGVRRSHQEIVLNGQYYGLREFLKGLTSLPTFTVPVETKVERDNNTRKIKASIHLVSYQSAEDSGD